MKLMNVSGMVALTTMSFVQQLITYYLIIHMMLLRH